MNRYHRSFRSWALGTGLGVLLACGPGGSEPARVEMTVGSTDDHLVPCTNDLGWEVTVTGARVAVADLEFTIQGETHAGSRPVDRERLWTRLEPVLRWLIPESWAHPGHQAGGEVTGEMPGKFLVDFSTGALLGRAILLEGEYHGMNLSFRTAGAEDSLPEGDPILGHTAVLEGTARKGGRTVSFRAVLDVPLGTKMIGGPFVLTVREDTQATLALALYTVDPSEGDTLFDGLDFGLLDDDQDGRVVIIAGQPAHNILAKTLVRHDHWGIVVR